LSEFQVYAEFLVLLVNFFENLKNSELKSIFSSEKEQKSDKYFRNFQLFTDINLYSFRSVIFEKVGFCFIDFKGNFSKFFYNLVYADQYSKDSLFERSNIEGENLFSMMTEFSKFIIRKEQGENFYDFKNVNKRNIVLKYTINVNNGESQVNYFTPNCVEEIIKTKCINYCNSVKTLTSRVSTILLQGNKPENKPIACILLETKLAKVRQNFDDIEWKVNLFC
jgi:hypothetical protein